MSPLSGVEKAVDFCFRTGKAGGEPKQTEIFGTGEGAKEKVAKRNYADRGNNPLKK